MDISIATGPEGNDDKDLRNILIALAVLVILTFLN